MASIGSGGLPPQLELDLIRAFPGHVTEIVKLFEAFKGLGWRETSQRDFCRKFILNWMFFHEMANAERGGVMPLEFVQLVEEQGFNHPAMAAVYSEAKAAETLSLTDWARAQFSILLKHCFFWL